ncbi:hypothetical protein MTR67_043668 [Solanum verrucosum]|uniref:Uncharacterized protein n=1 Tax=Solanum verrucosum TaxID=315347 RepID=A0AAF0ZUJ5_SOLVR|nr:hypothetical protein MTR67_043668 [Solanum verrucosum]
MYRDLREVYWWNGMNKYIAGFVEKCPNCQQVKAEHQKPGGLLQDIYLPTWKWEEVNMDFVVGLPRTRKRHDSIWVIIDRMTKSAHFLPVKFSFSAEDYAKLHIEEIVKLHGVPLSIILDRGLYQILTRVGKVAYELDLPSELALVHLVFHDSMLKKCIGDPVSILPLEGLGVDENLSYEEVSVEILDRQVKKLRNKKVVSVKVLWRNLLVEGATWEAEADMKSRYPHLFPSTPTLLEVYGS